MWRTCPPSSSSPSHEAVQLNSGSGSGSTGMQVPPFWHMLWDGPHGPLSLNEGIWTPQ